MDTADGKLVLPSLSVRLCSRFWQAPMLPWLVRGRRLLMGTARGKLVLPWLSVLDCGRKRATACAIAGESTAVDVPGCLLPGEGMAMAVWLGASGEGEA